MSISKKITVARFIEQLQLYQDKHDFTNSELAQLACVGRSTLHRWRTNVSHPQLSKMRAVAKRIRLSEDYIFEFTSTTKAGIHKTDWLVIQSSIYVYREAMRTDNINIAVDALQEIALSLYRFFSSLDFPVELSMSRIFKNEQLRISFPFSDIYNFGNYEIVVYGGEEDKVFATLVRVDGRHSTENNTIKIHGGVLTYSWLSKSSMDLLAVREAHERMIENFREQQGKFKQQAENNSVIP